MARDPTQRLSAAQLELRSEAQTATLISPRRHAQHCDP